MIEEDDHYMINEDQDGCHQLIITAVVPLDMGVYRCLAENNMGVASTKAELRVDREYCGSKKGCEFVFSKHADTLNLLKGFQPVKHVNVPC